MYVFIYVFIIWKIINSFPGSMTIKSHYGLGETGAGWYMGQVDTPQK